MKLKNRYGNMPSFEECWNRMRQKTDIENQKQLGKLVGRSQSYISSHKEMDVFLPEWAYFISQKYDVSMDWLLTGKNYAPNEEKDDLDFFLDDLRDWIVSLKSEDRKRWFQMKFAKAFPEFSDFVLDQLNDMLDVDHLRED